jgi:TonB family protein
VAAPCLNKKTNLRLTAEITAMKTKSKLTLSLGLLAAPLALMAWSPEKAYVESYRMRAGETPVPTSVISPEVSAKFTGKQVMLEFVVDPTGKPTSITSVTPGADAGLVATVTEAVSQWKFSPALVNGKPVARKVALPVNIVAYNDNISRFAAN